MNWHYLGSWGIKTPTLDLTEARLNLCTNLGLDGGLVELTEDRQVLLLVVNVGDDVGLFQLRQARGVQGLVLRM